MTKKIKETTEIETVKKEIDEYPGVKFNEELKKYIATYRKDGVVHVATCDTFEKAKLAMIEFEKI